MGLWSRIERTVWTGDVVKDYGVISDGLINGVRRKVSVVLAGKGDRRVFIRVSYQRWFAASVRFIELDRDSADKLHTALGDALNQM